MGKRLEKKRAKRHEKSMVKNDHFEAIIATVKASGYVPTIEEVMAKQTAAGGWTREDLASFGVSWPPTKGWLEDIRTHQSVNEAFDQLQERQNAFI